MRRYLIENSDQIIPEDEIVRRLNGPDGPEKDRAIKQLSYFHTMKALAELVRQGKIPKEQEAYALRTLIKEGIDSVPIPPEESFPGDIPSTIEEEG